jgi:uncharacterized membrane protein
VAIATALMPPLAVFGYGLSTWNLPVLGGSLALFVTNFITIALSAMIMARYYGFGHPRSCLRKGRFPRSHSPTTSILWTMRRVPRC